MSRVKKRKKQKKKLIVIPLLIVLVLALLFSFFLCFKRKLNKSSLSKNHLSQKAFLNNVSNNTNGSSISNSTDNTNLDSNSTPSSNEVSSTNNTPSSNEVSSSNNKSSTNKTNYVVQLPSNAEASKGNSITVDNATALLKNKLDIPTSNINISYDHTQSKNNVNYYVFQAFSSNSSSKDTATMGWYYVNTSTGDLFSYDINTDKLNPLK
jgi:cytoskeletal protein RodZ